jgi:hypothetical protein
MATAKTKTRSKAAPKPPSRKAEDKAQYERFREFAREVETDEDSEAFDQKFRNLMAPKSKTS